VSRRGVEVEPAEAVRGEAEPRALTRRLHEGHGDGGAGRGGRARGRHRGRVG
jgi:hypothetical protein